ncbi:MAG: primosomal protein N' [Bacillota bacterium]|nr:primosomal protein N' [Bacillota bacterium]
MINQILIVQVILDHYHEKLDHLFDYMVPRQFQSHITAGMRVLVPFGKSNRMLEAFVMETAEIQETTHPLKEIHQILDEQPVLSAEQLQMVRWMTKAYFCRSIEAIRCFVPSHRAGQKKKTMVQLAGSPSDGLTQAQGLTGAPVQQRILCCLADSPKMPLKKLMDTAGAGRSSVMALAKKGYVIIQEESDRRDPLATLQRIDYPEPTLSQEQALVIEDIHRHWKHKPSQEVLLHGITGSGKTEVYMQLIKETLSNNRDSIMLVPEISLTPQMVQRFRGRFGDQVAVLHSHLSEGERLDEWHRIRSGEARIIIGPRSAIFAPCRDLGMIIIDEEHESTYKSEQSPRYHAHEIALLRSRLEKAQLVLGSATPSVEVYHRALHHEMKLVQLKERATGGFLPEVTIVDLRDEVRHGNCTLFSKPLVDSLRDCLGQGHQAILLLNRRAFATYVNCLHCGHVIQCEHCDITMKWHKKEKVLKCHYCGTQHATPEHCPECERPLAYQGAGTQRAEETLKSLFPENTIMRMDQDATRLKGSHQAILEQFATKSVDILIGTQMIAKGLDFPNVTLVGILLADTSLNLPDFRASERTFQLITQVAGRAGRGAAAGKVVLQTYQPEHYAVDLAAHQDYERFYHLEIQLRSQFHYPPFTRLMQVTFTGPDERQVGETAVKIARGMAYMLEEHHYSSIKDIVLEPGPALVNKVENRYRYTLLLKTAGVSFSFLKKMVKYLLVDKKEQQIPAEMTVVIDPDPRFIQ